MTKQKTTKRALLLSALSLLLCVSMLVGSTFAWFTDSVTSSGNIIKSGDLDVEMYWAEGDEDPAAAAYKNAAEGAIFQSELWEPGYTEAKHIKVANVGTLALKYQMRILANGVVSQLADVIDVYYFDTATQLTRSNYATGTKLGTLSQVLNNANANAISAIIAGSLTAEGTENDSKTITIALHMQESAGNEYQNLSIGSDFSIQLLATQYTSEDDSFGNTYDNGSDFVPMETPVATVYALSPAKLKGITAGATGATLDTGYSFQPVETYGQAMASKHSWAHADFFVYADADVPAESMALAGYYNAFNGLEFGGQTLSESNWIALTSPADIAAGKENGVRLINAMGVNVPYNMVCQFGNDGTGFLCGAVDLTGANSGTTITVELRLYETYPEGECPADHGGHSSKNCETGEYIVAGTTTYTFPEKPLTVKSSAELTAAVAAGATDIVLADGTYEITGCENKTLNISGTKNAIIIPTAGESPSDGAGVDASFGGSTITFNGVTIKSNGYDYSGWSYMTGVYNNCYIDGAYTTINNSHAFNNCTFKTNGYVWTWGANVDFNGCTFTGDSRAILAHGGSSTVININDCDFEATEKGHTYGGDWTAAVEIDPIPTDVIYTINFTGDNTLSENYSGWYRVKDGSTGHVITGVN